MSDLNINDLPPEILAKILRFLDCVNLKNANRTCKLWNNVSESECRWSLKLDVKNACGRKPKPQRTVQAINFCLKTNRRFGTIEMSRGHFSSTDSKILQIFERQGFNIVRLTLHEGHIDDIVKFAELLEFTPNLEYAAIRYISFDGATDMPTDNVLPDLGKLKTLEIVESDQRIVKCFGKTKLTTIKIIERERSDNYGPLIDFVTSQKLLTSLSVSYPMLSEMGKMNVAIPFSLKHLSIVNPFGRLSSSDSDIPLRFLQTLADSLLEVEIGGFIPRSFYECIFADMTKINTLSLCRTDIPRDRHFYDKLEENGSVRTLKLRDTGYSDYYGNFIKKLPNIHSLVLDHPVDFSENVWTEMRENQSKIESLSIGLVTTASIDFINLRNLKALRIRDLLTRINWNEFIKIHSQLSELTIETMDGESFFTSADFDQITTNVQLHTVRLGVGFEADDRFFEIVRTKCADLKVLELHRSCVFSQRLRNQVSNLSVLHWFN